MFPFILITKSTDPRIVVTVMFWTVIVLLAGLAVFCLWAAHAIQAQPAPDLAQIAFAHRTAKWSGGIIMALLVLRYLLRRRLDS